eukprot:gene9314-239_t
MPELEAVYDVHWVLGCTNTSSKSTLYFLVTAPCSQGEVLSMDPVDLKALGLEDLAREVRLGSLDGKAARPGTSDAPCEDIKMVDPALLLTRLMVAAFEGDLPCLATLLGRGVDPLAQDTRGSTALMYALGGRRAALAACLLQQQDGPLPAPPTEAGGPPECDQVLLSDLLDAVSLLAPYGHPPGGAAGSLTPPIACVLANDHIALQWVIPWTSHLLGNTVDLGHTALHIASRSQASGSAQAFTRLIRHNMTDRLGLISPEGQACGSGALPDPTAQGLGKIWLDSCHSHTAVSLLLSAGAPCDATNARSETPLHLAAGAGRAQVAALLLAACPNLTHAQDHLGRSPAMVALSQGWVSIALNLMPSLTPMSSNPVQTTLPASKGLCDSVRPLIHWGRPHLAHALKHISLLRSVLPPECVHIVSVLESLDANPSPPSMANKDYPATAALPPATPAAAPGWSSPSDGWQEFGNITCTVHQFALSPDLTSARAEVDRIRAKAQPTLIHGALADWGPMHKWGKDQFLDVYGNNPTPTLAGMTVNFHQVSDFVKYIERHSSNPSRYPAYVFDSAVLDPPAAPSPGTNQAPSAPPPPAALDWLYGRSSAQLTLGSIYSGTPPHFHEETALALAAGVKLWFFFPPPQAHFVVSGLHVEHAMRWYEAYMSKGALQPYGKPFMCLQAAGQVMYVPPNWAHAVINVNTTLGVAYQSVW